MVFRMLGNKVELIRYKITWQKNRQEITENCISEEHKNEVAQMLAEKEIEFTVQAINQTNNEWLDGLEFSSYDEALEAFNKGEEAYNQERQRQELMNNLRLRADIDYIAVMSGVEI